MGFPTDMFPVLFTIPRVAGWLAHWNEFVTDSENKIVRPRQNYQGLSNKRYVNIEDRPQVININLISFVNFLFLNIFKLPSFFFILKITERQ